MDADQMTSPRQTNPQQTSPSWTSPRQSSAGQTSASRVRLLFAAACVWSLFATSSAQAAPRDEWATVTHAGNQAYVRQETPFDEPEEVGRVDYEYQIRKTEVTGGEWWEFVQAYRRYVLQNEANSEAFYGSLVGISYNPDNSVNYSFHPGNENRPVKVGWRYAARFVNWLHNGKALTQDAFEHGVYDTSTFSTNADFTITDQTTRSPGATYWIPSEDEWVKAAYFDPNRYGQDQPGYWIYPNGSDQPLTPGLPGSGQTSAGWDFFSTDPVTPRPDVAAYSDTVSPWGLWDVSGGVNEWLENIEDEFFPAFRGVHGTDLTNPHPDHFDRIDQLRGADTPTSLVGLRLARSVPTNSTFMIIGLCLANACTRRRTNVQ